jgi:hypothetical protein
MIRSCRRLCAIQLSPSFLTSDRLFLNEPNYDLKGGISLEGFVALCSLFRGLWRSDGFTGLKGVGFCFQKGKNTKK